MQSGFLIIHRVGSVGIFVFLTFENKMDREICHFNYKWKYYDKCECIRLSGASNLFPLEAVQKCQRYQLCVLREKLELKLLLLS